MGWSLSRRMLQRPRLYRFRASGVCPVHRGRHVWSVGGRGGGAILLKKKQYGLTKGSKIMRRAQFSCAALAVCAGIGLQTTIDIRSPAKPAYSFVTHTRPNPDL